MHCDKMFETLLVLLLRTCPFALAPHATTASRDLTCPCACCFLLALDFPMLANASHAVTAVTILKKNK
jgi:hypothetical protein